MDEQAILCIVDMQPKFPAANDESTVTQVLKLIQQQKEKLAPIIVLEYQGFGKTHRDIKAEVDSYFDTSYVTKDDDDGAEAIGAYLRFFPKEILLCGVNLEACVAQTACGLARHNSKVIIKAQACCSSQVTNTRTIADIVDRYGLSHIKGISVDWS